MKLINRALIAGAVAATLLPVGAGMRAPAAHGASCITVSTLQATGWSGADQEAMLVRQGIKQFEATNPCIRVQYSPIPSTYQQKLQTEFASKSEPDVMYVSPDMIASEGRAGLLLKLDPYLAKDHVSLSQYIPALLQTFQIKGSTYGLPKDWGTLGVFYNKDIFDAKHVAYPSNNLTFDQFRALAKKVYTPSSNPSKAIYGTMTPETTGRFMAFVYGYGSDIFDPATGKVQFNNPKAIQALDFYTGMMLKDHSATVPSTVGDGWQGDSFGKGRAAMVIEGGWLTPYLNTTYAKTKFGVAEFPIGPAGRADPVFTNAWAASARTSRKEAAAKFVEFMTGVSYQRQQLHAGFALPTVSSLQDDPYLKSHPEVANLFATYKVGKRGNFLQYDTVVNKAMDDAITSVILGKSTPAKAIASAATTVQGQTTSIP